MDDQDELPLDHNKCLPKWQRDWLDKRQNTEQNSGADNSNTSNLQLREPLPEKGGDFKNG